MKPIYKSFSLIISLLIFAKVLSAQPLPPADPGANPVPAGGMIYLLIAAITAIGVRKLSKKERTK
ncbi:MAG: hypothetical protein K9H26_07520 [Prolixibacteraceae bacterium]|nr:hypothetical protein [Prolixibacteraceae bacterium]